MVLFINIPLKESDEAIVKFLLSMVFGPQRKLASSTTRKECLRHDVLRASKLIAWIIQNDKKNRKCLNVACNLVYGNTIVLDSQVARLLHDALRARDIISYNNLMILEEDRRRRTREQMEKGLDDEYTPRKRKRTSKANESDQNLISAPALISTALRQNITMADVHSLQKEDNILVDDDLAPLSEQQYEMLYGMLSEPDGRSSVAENQEKTFIDRYSSNDVPENPLNLNIDFEIDRPSDEFLRQQIQTPTKERERREEEFEPAENLDYILRFGRLPLLDEGRQKSMDEEMEECRSRAINEMEMEMASAPQMEVPRFVSEQLDLDDDVIIPPRISRTPLKNQQKGTEMDSFLDSDPNNNNNKISLKEMHYMMEDFSSLHFPDTQHFRKIPEKSTSLKELLGAIPVFLQKKKNKELWTLFKSKPKKFNADVGNPISSSEDEEEDEEGNSKKNGENHENLPPMHFLQTPLKTPTNRSPERQPPVEFEMREEFEAPRRAEGEDLFAVQPAPPQQFEDPLQEDNNWNRFGNSTATPVKTIDWSNSGSNEVSNEAIRQQILSGCQEAAPYELKLNSLMRENMSRRDAARHFYVVLELVKSREIVAEQKIPFGEIELHIDGALSEDLDDLASQETN